MFDWLKPKSGRERIPEYAALRKTPNRNLPADLTAPETAGARLARRSEIENWLREPPRMPRGDAPLFFALAPAGKSGVIMITLPSGSSCVPVFSTIHRAGDYRRTAFPKGPPAAYLALRPSGMVELLQQLTAAGIKQFAPDLCPRCGVGVSIANESIKSPQDLIKYWVITRAGDLAHLELNLDYALACARNGKRTVAREVALETVGHVGFEDPRTHFLLGQIAVALDDRDLLREAKAFLRFLGYEAWVRKLETAAHAGTPDFAFPDMG